MKIAANETVTMTEIREAVAQSIRENEERALSAYEAGYEVYLQNGQENTDESDELYEEYLAAERAVVSGKKMLERHWDVCNPACCEDVPF